MCPVNKFIYGEKSLVPADCNTLVYRKSNYLSNQRHSNSGKVTDLSIGSFQISNGELRLTVKFTGIRSFWHNDSLFLHTTFEFEHYVSCSSHKQNYLTYKFDGYKFV